MQVETDFYRLSYNILCFVIIYIHIIMFSILYALVMISEFLSSSECKYSNTVAYDDV